MPSTEHRTALLEYIATADERKVEAMYILVEQEIEDNQDHVLSEEQWKELENRISLDKAGSLTYTPWREVLHKIRARNENK